MATPTITNVDNSIIAMGDNEYRSALLTVTGAGTFKKGVILATSTTSGKYVPFVKGGTTAGNGIATAVLENELVATAPGDVAVRPIISGLVSADKLILQGDGDGSNVDEQVLESLKQSSIVAIKTTEQNLLDNQ